MKVMVIGNNKQQLNIVKTMEELNQKTVNDPSPVDTIIMPQEKCGCGRPVRYMVKGDRMSCNKYSRCMSYEELSKHRFWLTQLLEAYRKKRSVDGLNGRDWNAVKHLKAEREIEALEKTAEKINA